MWNQTDQTTYLPGKFSLSFPLQCLTFQQFHSCCIIPIYTISVKAVNHWFLPCPSLLYSQWGSWISESLSLHGYLGDCTEDDAVSSSRTCFSHWSQLILLRGRGGGGSKVRSPNVRAWRAELISHLRPKTK